MHIAAGRNSTLPHPDGDTPHGESDLQEGGGGGGGGILMMRGRQCLATMYQLRGLEDKPCNDKPVHEKSNNIATTCLLHALSC